ncbi:MAG: hypothetical protein ACLQAT_31245 [Candidatus Binataceae bacterium]
MMIRESNLRATSSLAPRLVAKRRDSLYKAGKRSGVWQKMRINRTAEFVIGGYTPGSSNFDALLVGNYEGRKLTYVAKVRAGLTPALRESVFQRFRGLETKRSPFRNLPESHRVQLRRRLDEGANGQMPLA